MCDIQMAEQPTASDMRGDRIEVNHNLNQYSFFSNK